MKKCDGACESHVGEVVTVHVETVSGYDWGEFDYCEEAIAEDRRRGLIVTPSNNSVYSDAGDSAASSEVVNASAESTFQTETKPAQRG